jgi:hypothetical protein
MDGNSTPDTTKADANAARMVNLNEDQWNWVKQQYAAEAPDRQNASDRANQVSDLQIEGMKKQIALGDEAAGDYRTIYKPLEQKMANEAMSYDTEAHREDLAGKARTDVEAQAAAQRAATERNMASMGVNVSDPAYAALNDNMGRDVALAKVAAGNKARTDATTMGHALTMDAIGVGRGVVGSQATSAGIAVGQGNAAAANAQIPVQVGQGGVNMVQQGANYATNGLNAAGNIYQRSAELQANANSANQGATAGLAGAGMTAAAIF